MSKGRDMDQKVLEPEEIDTEISLKVQRDQLDAAVRAAARPELPPDAKPGEWLHGYVDYIEYPGGWRAAVGPKLWIPKYLCLARVLLLLHDQGTVH
jgi:hypothetical protein